MYICFDISICHHLLTHLLLAGRKKGDDGSEAAEVCASDSDEGLEEFVPKAEVVSKTLSKATNNESEEESSGHTPGLLTPDALSQGPSRDISDTGTRTRERKSKL